MGIEMLLAGRGCLGCVQDIPVSYWRTYGADGFDGVWYTLHGPLKTWNVKTATRSYGKQTFCSFTEGWAGFCTGNRLKLGDKVVFTKVGPVEFQVKKV